MAEHMQVVEVDIIPSPNDQGVQNVLRNLESKLQIRGLITMIEHVGNYMYISTNSAARDARQLVKVQDCLFSIIKLIDACSLMLQSCQSGANNILEKLKVAYLYLLDGFPDFAMTDIEAISKDVNAMQNAVDKHMKCEKSTETKIRETNGVVKTEMAKLEKKLHDLQVSCDQKNREREERKRPGNNVRQRGRRTGGGTLNEGKNLKISKMFLFFLLLSLLKYWIYYDLSDIIKAAPDGCLVGRGGWDCESLHFLIGIFVMLLITLRWILDLCIRNKENQIIVLVVFTLLFLPIFQDRWSKSGAVEPNTTETNPDPHHNIYRSTRENTGIKKTAAEDEVAASLKRDELNPETGEENGTRPNVGNVTKRDAMKARGDLDARKAKGEVSAADDGKAASTKSEELNLETGEESGTRPNVGNDTERDVMEARGDLDARKANIDSKVPADYGKADSVKIEELKRETKGPDVKRQTPKCSPHPWQLNICENVSTLIFEVQSTLGLRIFGSSDYIPVVEKLMCVIGLSFAVVAVLIVLCTSRRSTSGNEGVDVVALEHDHDQPNMPDPIIEEEYMDILVGIQTTEGLLANTELTDLLFEKTLPYLAGIQDILSKSITLVEEWYKECKDVVEPSMGMNINRAAGIDEDERANYWNSMQFKQEVVGYYYRWKALQVYCEENRKDLRATRQRIENWYTENLHPREAVKQSWRQAAELDDPAVRSFVHNRAPREGK